MQSVSSRIWTRVAVSISYDDNHCTTGTSCHYYYYYYYYCEFFIPALADGFFTGFAKQQVSWILLSIPADHSIAKFWIDSTRFPTVQGLLLSLWRPFQENQSRFTNQNSGLCVCVCVHIYIYIYMCVCVCVCVCVYIYKVHTISFQTFFVWAFKIVVGSWKFTRLLLYILWDDWPIFMISASNYSSNWNTRN